MTERCRGLASSLQQKQSGQGERLAHNTYTTNTGVKLMPRGKSVWSVWKAEGDAEAWQEFLRQKRRGISGRGEQSWWPAQGLSQGEGAPGLLDVSLQNWKGRWWYHNEHGEWKERGNRVVMRPHQRHSIYFRKTKIIQRALGNSISHNLKEQKIDFTLELHTE